MTAHLAKITSKGQMTLPVEVRRALGVGTGDFVRIEKSESGEFTLKSASRAADLAGIIRYTGPPLTVEEIRAASRATFK